jgi:hypothetical protein
MDQSVELLLDALLLCVGAKSWCENAVMRIIDLAEVLLEITACRRRPHLRWSARAAKNSSRNRHPPRNRPAP